MPQTTANYARLYFLGKRDLLSQADCYWRGLSVDHDEALALELCAEAMRQNVSGASFKLASFHQQKGRIDEALELYYQAYREANLLAKTALQEIARAENPKAMVYLALVFEIEKNWGAAQKLYLSAIALGFVPALHHLAVLLEEGRSVVSSAETRDIISKNTAEACRLYKTAAALGDADSLVALERLADTDKEAAFLAAQVYELSTAYLPPKALFFYKQASRLGHAEASFRLAKVYESGELSMAIIRESAVDYYFLAIRQDHDSALSCVLHYVENSANAELEFKLAEFYVDCMRDKISALGWYKRAAEKGSSSALKRLKAIATLDAEFAYAAANLYAEALSSEKDKQLIYFLYALAAHRAHREAKCRLDLAVERAEAEAQYALACYHQERAESREAINLCLLAADQGHAGALNYLTKTSFDKDFYLFIAHSYENGERVRVNKARAIEFYMKAALKGSAEAAFRLGQFYEAGLPELTIDILQAAQYYLQAAQLGKKEAVIILERLIASLENAQLEFKLAEFHLDFTRDHLLALPWYKKSADRSNARAITQLNVLAERDAEFAFQAARLYEQGANFNKAFHYYVLAMRKDHVEAREKMESFIRSKNPEAQYAVAYGYYHHKGCTDFAISLCLQAAEHGHEKAQRYLQETDFSLERCLRIALAYERGMDVRVNLLAAIGFYIKAYKRGDKSKAIHIAELYSKISDEMDTEKALEEACHYYILAVNEGCLSALDELDELIELALPATQKRVMELYRLPQVMRFLGEVGCRERLANIMARVANRAPVLSSRSLSCANQFFVSAGRTTRDRRVHGSGSVLEGESSGFKSFGF